MNPYLIIGVLVAWTGSTVGAFFYGHHVADQACDGKVQAVQLLWQQQQTKVATANEQAAMATAQNVDATTEAHHENTQRLGRQAAQVQQQIRAVHDAAPATDCLRSPVDPRLDQLLRNPAAGAGDPAPEGHPSG